MGSNDVGALAVLGGRPAYQEHASGDVPSAHDALRALMPDPTTRTLFDASRAMASGLMRLFATNFVERVDDLQEFVLFLATSKQLPFGFVPVQADDGSQDFEGYLEYYPEQWRDLDAQPVVILLSKELGLESAEVGLDSVHSPWAALPSQGVLRIPRRFFGGPAPFGVMKLALRKLSNAYDDAPTRLIAWADSI